MNQYVCTKCEKIFSSEQALAQDTDDSDTNESDTNESTADDQSTDSD